jgi:hypothetical protein
MENIIFESFESYLDDNKKVDEFLIDKFFGYDWKGVEKRLKKIDTTNDWEVNKLFDDTFADSLELGGVKKLASDLTINDKIEMVEDYIKHKGGSLVYDKKSRGLIFLNKEETDKRYPSDFVSGGTGGVRTNGGV